jgi:NAD(P)-dependent dehydrogenase (short-subunit alcohol dehydrogenase family)
MQVDDLTGRVAVVTGALGNLGPVWCSTLTGTGMTVIGIDVRPGLGMEEADVRDRAALRAILDRVVAEHEPPLVLVNNAGIDFPPIPGDGGQDEEAFAQTLAVNVQGVFNATEVFGGAMCDAGRGAIINIGSLYASVAPDPSFYDHIDPPFVKPSAYGASKAAVISLTRYFARLWGPYGVRVNALSPGGIRVAQDPEFQRKFCARVPLGRMGETGDLGGPLLFLASAASAYVTGQELRVDGGFTA